MARLTYILLCVISTQLLLLGCCRYYNSSFLSAFFESFQVHIGIGAFAVAGIALSIRRHWYAALVALASMAIAGHGLAMRAEFRSRMDSTSNVDEFQLISFNVEGSNFSNSRRIVSTILGSNADVVAIFEAEPLKAYTRELATKYPHQIGCGASTSLCDTLILSKHAIAFFQFRSLSRIWYHRWIRADIEIGNQKISFVFVHLTKPYFDKYQSGEVIRLRKSLQDLKNPLVVAGDFNTGVTNPDVQKMMRKAHLTSFFPEPATWPTFAGAFGISIDHVFTRDLRLLTVERMHDNLGSNHFGLKAQIGYEGHLNPNGLDNKCVGLFCN